MVALTTSKFHRPPPAYHALGVLSTLVGTFLAVDLVPEDVSDSKALFEASLAFAICLAIAPLSAAIRDVRALLRIDNILALAPIFWLLLEPLQNQWDPGVAGAAQVKLVFLCIGGFTAALWIGSGGKILEDRQRKGQSAFTEISPKVLFSLGLLAFVLAFLKFAIPCHFNLVEMFGYLLGGRWSAPWGRGDLGGWDAFLDHLAYFGYLLPSIAVRLAALTSWRNRRVWILLFFTLVIGLFLAQGGGRRIIGVLGLSGLLVYALSLKALRARHVLSSLALVGLLMWVTQTMLTYRNVGFGALFNEEAAAENEDLSWGYYHVDSNLNSFSNLAVFVPEKHPYVYHRYFIWVLVRPVPRVFWPGKPVDFGFSLPDALGAKGVSLSVTIIGELYVAGGGLMVLLGGFVYGKFARALTRLIAREHSTRNIMIYAIASLALFAGYRSGIDLMLMLYPALGWWALHWWLIVSKRRQQVRLRTEGVIAPTR